MIIAIDGPAGSGKSSTARAVASRLRYGFLETGAMYRAIGLLFVRRGVKATEDGAARLSNPAGLEFDMTPDGLRVSIDGSDVTAQLADSSVSVMASKVSRFPSVRKMLVERQRRLARTEVERGGGVVIEGRDIGSVVFPEADLKIYMDADPRVRARRRRDELLREGVDMNVDEVLSAMSERDRRDRERPNSPLTIAEGARVVDTTRLSFDAQVDLIVDWANEVSSKHEHH